jgi:hypothetical protein
MGGGDFPIGISYWKIWMQNIGGLLFTKKLKVIVKVVMLIKKLEISLHQV